MKFNQKKSNAEELVSQSDAILNEEGGIAFKPELKTELTLRTVSSMISEDSFYKTGEELDSELRDIIHAVAKEDPEFILKLAYYTRTYLHLRSAPVVLMGEFSLSEGKGKIVGASDYISKTIQRPDEITELISYVRAQDTKFRGKMPMVIKKGVRKAFNQFDAYQIVKYNRSGDVTLRDAMFMTHPTPKNDQQAKTFKALADNTLESAQTWEYFISTNGSTKENWETIIPKMGYMALLRNLRNFIEKGVDIDPVLARITDRDQVLKSKQFPYRFLSAFKELSEVEGSGKILDALSDAADHSVENVPEYKGRTFVTCDISGSMNTPLTRKTKIKQNEVGCMFGAMVHAMSNDAIVSVFGETHVPVSLSKRDSLFTNTMKLLKTNAGHSTNAYKAIDYLISKKEVVDRIIIFSDMQCYDDRYAYGGRFLAETLRKYRQQVNPNVYVYSFDLDSYGSTQFPEDEPRVCLAGGFSDQVLKFIPLFESSKTSMISDIENIKL